MDVNEEGWLRVHDAVLNWKKLKSKTNHSLWSLYFLFPLSISYFFIIILAHLFLAGPTFFLGRGRDQTVILNRFLSALEKEDT